MPDDVLIIATERASPGARRAVVKSRHGSMRSLLTVALAAGAGLTPAACLATDFMVDFRTVEARVGCAP